MINHALTYLVREEPAWPDAVRVPLADEKMRLQLSAAAQVITGKIAAATWSKPELGQITLTQRLLQDWARGRVPQRPPLGTITTVQDVLRKFDLADAEATLKGLWPGKLEEALPPVPFSGPQIIVRVPPPSALSGLTTFFPPSASQLELARAKFSSYQSWYAKLGDRKTPLRSREFRMTGLPGYLNGQLKAPPTTLDPETWRGAAQTWLFQQPDDADATASPAACSFRVSTCLPRNSGGSLNFSVRSWFQTAARKSCPPVPCPN